MTKLKHRRMTYQEVDSCLAAPHLRLSVITKMWLMSETKYATGVAFRQPLGRCGE
jgi:hypothetical protein